MTKIQYYTARCPLGCESWLHPHAVLPHTRDLDRCKRRPWIDLLPDEALVAAPLASLLEAVMPEGTVQYPTFSEDRLLGRRGRTHAQLGESILVRSPIEGIAAQRWAAVLTIAERHAGPQVIEDAFSPEGFAGLEDALHHREQLTACRDCGATTSPRGLNIHRASSTSCRWRRAAAEVRRLWDEGWRDPHIVAGAPNSWTELCRPAWRTRVHVVPFPALQAVLLRPQRIP
jgi:hypothetical protein